MDLIGFETKFANRLQQRSNAIEHNINIVCSTWSQQTLKYTESNLICPVQNNGNSFMSQRTYKLAKTNVTFNLCVFT